MTKQKRKKKTLLAIHRCRGGNFSSRRRLQKIYQLCRTASKEKRHKFCPSGCLGCGDCVAACPEAAITMEIKLLPQIDREKCIGCGKCVKACPRNIIVLRDQKEIVHILCLSTQSPQDQKRVCHLGCDGCKRCEIACPCGSITVRDNLAVITRQTCINCGLCAEWCPQRCIQFNSRSGAFNISNPLADVKTGEENAGRKP